MKQILVIGYHHHNQTIILTGENMNTNIKQVDMQHREVSISKLPDTIKNKIRFTTWVRDIDKATVTIIAKVNHLDWIAYIGYPDIETVKDELKNNPDVQYHCVNLSHYQNILAYGDILDCKSANELFPEWSYLRYRE